LNSRAIAELPQVLAANALMSDAETRFLDALYRGAIDESELTRALQLVQDMFQCRSGAFVSFDTRAPAADLSMVSGIFNEYGRLYLEQFVAIDPAPLFFSRLASGTASTSDRILSEQERNALPFFNEFFRPIGLTETLAGNLFNDRGRFSLIGLQRGDDRSPFDDGDIARLERLMPHVTRAVQLRRAFVRIEAQNHALQAAIDRLPAGLVLLDADGGAVFVNATMRALTRRADGLSLDRSGRPLLANLAARRRFDALLHDVSKGGAGGVLSAPRTSGAPDYAVLVSPSPASLAQLRWDKPGIAGSLVLVHDPDSRSQSPPDVLEQGLNLPKGAAKLVAALAADEDLKSFAEREGITIHTVRFHLHTALARTGTRNQAELVRIAVRLLRDFALAES
jgi:PAS domain-containing protein